MFSPRTAPVGAADNPEELRRHPRHTVFRSALVYPVLLERDITVTNLSSHGLSAQGARGLDIREQVHVSFDAQDYISAEVRWANGSHIGLMLEEPLLWVSGKKRGYGSSG